MTELAVSGLAGATNFPECRRAQDAKRDVQVALSPSARRQPLCPGPPRSGATASARRPPIARAPALPWLLREWLDGVSDALADGLRGYGTYGPFATAAARPRSTPIEGRPASLRSPCRSDLKPAALSFRISSLIYRDTYAALTVSPNNEANAWARPAGPADMRRRSWRASLLSPFGISFNPSPFNYYVYLPWPVPPSVAWIERSETLQVPPSNLRILELRYCPRNYRALG